ncbi:MAG: Dihydroorotate dehydrogenase B (NAD(+)), catalytic subunit [Syntrophorhabdaceae bacterium PtaU1.Bin034]|nr:MAG: Dihydroorotate dehydrogenase B (NAD(+)), catalytic subunit [Syntrophorhabdaceae bacterium PtaU1.Bin034]
MADLSITLFGKRLRNPVMNASGTLGYGSEIELLWTVDALGAYVSKGLSFLPHHGNPPPRLSEENSALMNSVGLQNIGVKRFFSEVFPLFVKRRTHVMINFFGFTEEDYLTCAESIKPDELIVALEINLSCPNIKQGGICLGKEAEGVFRIIKKVKEVTSLPLVAKLTPEVTDIVAIARAAYEAGADGITVLNTFPAATVDIEKMNIPLRGGLSGPFLKPMALRAVADISKSIPVPVIGVGGIMNDRDALAFLMAGATAVQVGTATFVDPFTIPKIVKGIEAYMEAHHIADIGRITGTARAEG